MKKGNVFVTVIVRRKTKRKWSAMTSPKPLKKLMTMIIPGIFVLPEHRCIAGKRATFKALSLGGITPKHRIRWGQHKAAYIKF